MRRPRLLALAFSGVLACQAARWPEAAAPAATEAERLVQDLEYALAAIEARHPDPWAHVERAAVRAEIEAARALGAKLDRTRAFRYLMRLVAHFDDAHTRLGSWSELEATHFPFLIEPWSDGLWIAAVPSDSREMFGLRLVALDGQPVSDLIQRLAPYVQHENVLQLESGAARLLSLPIVLESEGLLKRPSRVRLDVLDLTGKPLVLEVQARERASLGPWTFFAPAGWRAPLWREKPSEDWSWRTLAEGRALYLQFNRCVEREAAPFDETARELLARIDAGGIDRLIIDLRLNGGGNSRVLSPLIAGLERRARALSGERVLVLIGRGTFSSAETNAQQLQRDVGARLVGEPTSQKPDGFGEVRSVELPNTHWQLDVSTKAYTPFGDDRPWLAPDVPVANGFADLLAGRDPVLERVLAMEFAP